MEGVFSDMEEQKYTPPVLPPQEEHHRQSVTAMVLSIIGLAIFFLPIANIAGLVLSIIGFIKAKNNRQFALQNGIAEDNLNTTGYVCGLIGIIVGGIGVALTLFGIFALLGLITLAVTTTTATDMLSQAAPAIGEIVKNILTDVAAAL